MATITQKRAQEPKGTLRNLMLKEIANSFYGKLAQAIENRNLYNFTGQKERLKPSAITTPHYAAMCTGIVRAALCAVVYEVGKRDDCEVLSATTDGCMIAVPKRFKLDVDSEGRVKGFDFAAYYPELYEAFKTHYAVMALEQGRQNMGHPPDTWLEVKHAGDYAMTFKTRGNILKNKDVTQHLARAGHQVHTAQELIALHECEGIAEVEGRSLASMRDIYRGIKRDLVRVTTKKAANTDFDYKRIPLPDDSGRTRPPKTVVESAKYRHAADHLRKRGTRATPENVALNLQGHTLRGGQQASIKRYIHQAIAQNQGQWRPRGLTDRTIENRLGLKKGAFKNLKKRKFKPQSLPITSQAVSIIRDEAAKLNIYLNQPRLVLLCQL